jgi:hypothetical protein
MKNKIRNDIRYKDAIQSNVPRYIQYIMVPSVKVSDLKRVVELNMEMQRLGQYVPPSK